MATQQRGAGDSPMILLLDDEPGIQLVVTRLLEHEGFSVTAAATGSAALATLATHACRTAMMIVDIKLPDYVRAGVVAEFSTE